MIFTVSREPITEVCPKTPFLVYSAPPLAKKLRMELRNCIKIIVILLSLTTLASELGVHLIVCTIGYQML